MRITAITQQKRDPNRYNIFIDGVYAFALPMQDILYFKLKEGQEAAEETIAFIHKNLIYIKAQDTFPWLQNADGAGDSPKASGKGVCGGCDCGSPCLSGKIRLCG